MARAHGFDAFGVTLPDATAGAGARLRAFLAAGSHGDMDWMARDAQRRGDPRLLWPDVRAIVMLGLNYGTHDDRTHVGPQRPRIGTAVGVARHPIHVAMAAGFEECVERGGRARDGVRPRHPEGVEAMRARRFGERVLGCGRRQKSRLA